MRTEQEIINKIKQFQTWTGIHYWSNTRELGDSHEALLRWVLGDDNTFTKNLAAWESLPEDVKKMRHQQYIEDEIIRRER